MVRLENILSSMERTNTVILDAKTCLEIADNFPQLKTIYKWYTSHEELDEEFHHTGVNMYEPLKEIFDEEFIPLSLYADGFDEFTTELVPAYNYLELLNLYKKIK